MCFFMKRMVFCGSSTNIPEQKCSKSVVKVFAPTADAFDYIFLLIETEKICIC